MPLSRIEALSTWLLSRANTRAQRLLTEALATHNLRPVHFRSLVVLDEQGALVQADLGRALGMDRKDVTVIVDELVAHELVRRDPDPTDGRRKIVSMTDDGRRLLPELDAAVTDAQTEVMAPLTAGERATLRALLAKLDPPT